MRGNITPEFGGGPRFFPKKYFVANSQLPFGKILKNANNECVGNGSSKRVLVSINTHVFELNYQMGIFLR
ncbi:hypothetical protein LF1_16660 [Rubripirellula obstinata]|uniref:Uncharacterized protein n=1 Tax=Rubripirellula obstinata TaxID=406547 RepID=A0A5B1CDA4_9BACT|nr:hypothetical protein LF1_16660 [Rubripirellula obstinata]